MRPLRPGLSHDGLEDNPEIVGGPGAFGYFSGKQAMCCLCWYVVVAIVLCDVYI